MPEEGEGSMTPESEAPRRGGAIGPEMLSSGGYKYFNALTPTRVKATPEGFRDIIAVFGY